MTYFSFMPILCVSLQSNHYLLRREEFNSYDLLKKLIDNGNKQPTATGAAQDDMGCSGGLAQQRGRMGLQAICAWHVVLP